MLLETWKSFRAAFVAVLREVASVMLESVELLVGVRLSGRGERDSTTLDDRIASLSTSLQQAAESMAAIETEVAERALLVERMRADAAHFEELASLKRSEVEAVAQALRGELRREGRRSFIANQAVNVLLVGLGVLLGQLF